MVRGLFASMEKTLKNGYGSSGSREATAGEKLGRKAILIWY